jgi:redox-sensitive bicupin YhaK (pirin superfamily)
MLEIRKASERGIAEHGWLSSRHTFSFGQYHDPTQVGFSDLLVINDDRVAPGKGFGKHPHKDMEIFTYVLDGALEHEDTMGTGSVIKPGDVQMMSAGTGIAHSEFNHSKSEPVHFLQIWIVPNKKMVVPRYQQIHFSLKEKRGKLRLIISPEGDEGSLSVYQDARIYAGFFSDGESATLNLYKGRFAYVYLARGNIKVNGMELSEGDGLRVREEHSLFLCDGHDAEVLVFDLRARELPDF